MSSGWVRWENVAPENLKVAPASDRAFRLYFNASCYCSRNLTNGRVPAAIITSLSRTATRKTVDELLELGLLERLNAETYLVHDYLDFNPSRERIEEMREQTRNRVSEYRKRDRNGVTAEEVTELQAEGVTGYSRVTSHARDRSVSSTDSVSSQGHRETKPEREPSKTVDPDEIPASLPAELRQTASETLRALEVLQAERGGYRPTARGVGLVLIRFPDRDHEAVVRELEYWALAGSGQNRQIRDWPRTLATFLERSPSGSAPRSSANVVQFGRRENASDWLRQINGEAS